MKTFMLPRGSNRCRLGLIVVCVFGLMNVAAKDVEKVSKKRGVSGDGNGAAVMNGSWYYNWYIDPTRDCKAEFVPMISHGKDCNSWYWDRIAELKKQGKIKCLLGFNEPERKSPGGEISVDDAVRDWPQFEKTGLKLGSPAPAFDPGGRKWLDDFMTKANQKHLRVDFICLHWYGDVADAKAADKFMGWLKEIHDKWDKPIWVTEFAGLNWDWLHHPITTEMNEKFVRELVPKLEKTDWVERYAWFSAKPADLFEAKKLTPTKLGRIYAGGS